MPKDYSQVREEYEQFKAAQPGTKLDLPSFAKQSDQIDGTAERQSAYEDGIFKRLNAMIDVPFEKLGLNNAGRWAGGKVGDIVDKQFGTHIAPTLEDVGGSLPRSIAEAAGSSLVPGPGWANDARILANIVKTAAYGSAAARGYAETGSPVGAAISAGSLGAGNYLIPKTGHAITTNLTRFLERGTEPLAEGATAAGTSALQKFLTPTVALAGEVGTATGVNEATRQGMMSVGDNAVGFDLRDPNVRAARDPLTQENIAANVGGALAFAPQLVEGLRNPQMVNSLHAKEIATRQAARTSAEKLALQSATIPDPTEVGGTLPSTTDRQSALLDQFSLNMREARAAREAGRPDQEDMAHELASSALREMTAGRYSPFPPELLQKVKEITSDSARYATMSPEEFEGFRKQTYDIINAVNDSKTRFQEELAQREENLNRGDRKAVAAHEEFIKGGVASKDFPLNPDTESDTRPLLESLWRNGTLKPLTPEWVEAEMNKHVALGHSESEAQRIVQQEMANYLQQAIPDAVDQQSRMKVTTEPSESVKGVDNTDREFISAITTLPEDIHANIGKRTVEIRRGVKVDERSGTLIDKSANWERMVKRAAETYDPNTHEITLPPTKKFPMGEKVNYTYLTEKTPDGYYKYNLGEQAVPVGAGGTNQVKIKTKDGAETSIAREQSIQAMEDAQRQGFDGNAVDEELVKQHVGESSIERGANDVAPTEDVIGAPVEKDNSGTSVLSKKDKALKTIDNLSDEQLWNLTRSHFNLRTREQGVAKAARIREELKGVLNNTGQWTDKQRSFFQNDSKIPGGTSTGEYHVERLGNIMKGLLDDKAVRMVKEGLLPRGSEPMEPGDLNTFSNPPEAGNFERDVVNVIRENVRNSLARDGYSGTSQDFAVEMGAAIVKANPQKFGDFFRYQEKDAAGIAQAVEGRGKLGLAVDREAGYPQNSARSALHLIGIIQHELVHFDEFVAKGLIPRPDAYSDKRMGLLDNMTSFLTKLTPQEREAYLTQVLTYLPKEFQTPSFDKNGKIYGMMDPSEALAELTRHAASMTLLDTPSGRAFAKEALDYGPTEFKALARSTFRTMADVMGAMTDKVNRGEGMSKYMDPFITDKGFQTILTSARELAGLRFADRALAEGRYFVANLGAPTVNPNPALWFRKADTLFKDNATMPETASETSIAAAKLATAALSPRAADKINRGNVVERFLMPFRNKMWAFERDNNPMARPIADEVFGIEADTNRVHSHIVDGFLKKNADGSVNYNADHPLIERIQREPTGRWRDEGINRISAWQQGDHDMGGGIKKDAQSMFVEDSQSKQIVVNPAIKDAQVAWDRIRRGFNPEDQQFLMNMSVAMDKMGAQSRDLLLAQVLRSHENAITAHIMGANRQMSTEDARRIASQIHKAFQKGGNPQSVATMLPPQQLQTLIPMIIGDNGTGGLMGVFNEVSQHLNDRPGYRTESLPHDWVIRYKNSAGETKFTSATTEKNAKITASRLAAQGNTIDGEIVNRREVNTFKKTDDPDNILTQASEKEAFVWSQALKEIEKVHGTQVMEDVQGAYNPLSEARVSAAEKIAGPVLKTRKDYVDRAEFDYIDAAMAASGRLARSIALRTAKQNIGLLLNDPSVRLQPSFRAMVEEHLAEMSRPQSEWSKQTKSYVTGTFLGANLGSALANATQSLSTLVPILDTMEKGGNMVTPWKRLTKAIGKATDMTMNDSWLADARSAAGKDPALWTKAEQTAALWKKQVENGGFTHTVVDDLVVGSDQKRLALAKFGRGDYGPVTKASLLGSGMYALNQFAMKPFRWVEHGNAKVAFLAGVEQAYEQGLRGDAAFSHANQVQGLATFGGGRANASGLQTSLSKGFSPGGAGLALALQQYSFGVVAMHAQFVKDSISGSKTLSPAEKMRMRRVYGTMLMTQTALAGALGLPLVGATLTVLEKVFGIPANQAVRDGLAHLSTDQDGNPDETGQAIGEIGMNGFANYLTGIDVASRLGTSSLLGTSSYRGFNWGDLMGPTAGILENGVKSLGYFASGEPLKAATELAPQALKNALQLQDNRTKYGDSGFRDKAGNLLYTPTPAEASRFALGIRPAGLSRKRQAEAAMRFANDTAQRDGDRELDEAARGLLQGDPSIATALSMNRVSADPTADPHEVLRSVMNRAVGMSTEKDLMATGAQLSEVERSRIARTFGEGVVNRRSEVAMQDLRSQLAMTLGDDRLQPSMESYEQAQLVDQLIQQQGMPRSQALRMMRFLQHGPAM